MGNKLCCTIQISKSKVNNCEEAPMTVISSYVKNCEISLSLGMIFNETVDAVVVVANSRLKTGQNVG